MNIAALISISITIIALLLVDIWRCVSDLLTSNFYIYVSGEQKRGFPPEHPTNDKQGI
jgi:hypothetical protein